MAWFKWIGAALIISLALVPPPVKAQVWVDGYYRDDGTYVEGHYRTEPNGIPYDNYSFPGNYNPNTGEITSGDPETYLENYYDNDSDSRITHDNTLSLPTETHSSGYDRDVEILQRALSVLEHYPGPIDGLYGPKTDRAVRSFQRSVGLTVDGIPGKKTLEAILGALRRFKTSGSLPRSSQTEVDGQQKTLSGRWRGSYVCGQGRTGLTLSLKNTSGSRVEGTFNFYPLEQNPDVPSGTYSVSGAVQQGGKLTLRGVNWIEKPSGYRMVGVEASIGPNSESIGGTICGNPFSLVKEATSGSAGQNRGELQTSQSTSQRLSLEGVWSGRLVRPGETWRVKMAFSQRGSHLRGAIRKYREDVSVLWKVSGEVFTRGASLKEERVLDENRLPSMSSNWQWCARSGRLKVKEGSRKQELVGKMSSRQNGCPDAKLLLNHSGKLSGSPTATVSTKE